MFTKIGTVEENLRPVMKKIPVSAIPATRSLP
jgi:hypothetical protein